jgi:hypothetical protein
MDQHEVTRVVQEVQALAEARYVYPGIGAQVAQVLAAGLAEGRYPADERQLAEAVTADPAVGQRRQAPAADLP